MVYMKVRDTFLRSGVQKYIKVRDTFLRSGVQEKET